MARGTETDLTARTYINTAAALLNAVVSVVVGFLVNPALLTYLGSVEFGTWKVCQNLLSFVSVADGQAALALKWTIANKQTSEDFEAKKRNIGSALIVWLRFLPATVLIGALISWFSPQFINGLDPSYVTPTRIAAAILVIGLILLPLQSIPESVMVGTNLGYRCSWIRTLQLALAGGLMVTLAYLGFGVAGVAGAYVVATIFASVGMLAIAIRTLPWFRAAKPRKNEVREFFGFSIWVYASAITNWFALSSDLVMIGIVSSASMVSAYVLTNYAVQTTLLVSVAFLVSSTPGIAGIIGSGDGVRAATIRKQILTISWLINVVMGTMILLWNRSFVALWVGSENYVGLLENLLMILLCIQLVFIRHDANIIDVTLNIRRKVLLAVLSGILSITLAYVLGTYVFPGVLGVVLGLLSGRLVLTISYPRLVSRALQAGDRDLGGWLRKALATALAFSAALFLAQRIELTSWFQLIAYAPPTFLPISIVSFYAGLSAGERKHVVKRLAAISRLMRPRPQP